MCYLVSNGSETTKYHNKSPEATGRPEGPAVGLYSSGLLVYISYDSRVYTCNLYFVCSKRTAHRSRTPHHTDKPPAISVVTCDSRLATTLCCDTIIKEKVANKTTNRHQTAGETKNGPLLTTSGCSCGPSAYVSSSGKQISS